MDHIGARYSSEMLLRPPLSSSCRAFRASRAPALLYGVLSLVIDTFLAAIDPSLPADFRATLLRHQYIGKEKPSEPAPQDDHDILRFLRVFHLLGNLCSVAFNVKCAPTPGQHDAFKGGRKLATEANEVFGKLLQSAPSSLDIWISSLSASPSRLALVNDLIAFQHENVSVDGRLPAETYPDGTPKPGGTASYVGVVVTFSGSFRVLAAGFVELTGWRSKSTTKKYGLTLAGSKKRKSPVSSPQGSPDRRMPPTPAEDGTNPAGILVEYARLTRECY